MRKIELVLCSAAILLLGGCVEGPGETQSTRTSPAAEAATADALSTEALHACYRAKQDLAQGVMNLVWKQQQGCETDADCRIVDPSISCQELCPVAVSVRAEQALSKTLEAHAASVCPTTPRICEMKGTCVPWTGARCVANTCRAVMEPRKAD